MAWSAIFRRVIGAALTAAVACGLLAGAGGGGGAAYGLDKGHTLTQSAHRIWQALQGLPQATIYCVHQTRDGYLWLGTLTGPVRFDGVRFTRVDRAGDVPLNNTPVLDIAQDKAGNIYLATDGQGLIRLPQGSAGVGGAGGRGLPGATQEGATRLLAGLRVARLEVDGKGNLWIATSAGLAKIEAGDASGVPVMVVKDVSFSGVCEGKDGRLWTVGGQTLGYWDGKAWESRSLQTLPPGATLQAVACDGQGMLWIGSSAGLIAVNPERGGRAGDAERRLTRADGLADDYVWCLTVGSGGVLWAGTRDGFSRVRPAAGGGPEIDSFRGKDGLSQSTAYGIAEDSEGSLWVATKHGLNQFFDGRVVAVTTQEGLASNDAGPILQDEAWRIWVGTLDAGLSKLELPGLAEKGAAEGGGAGMHAQTLTVADGLPSNRIVALARAGGGEHAVWIGTDKGLARLPEGGKVATFGVAEGLPSPAIRALVAGEGGHGELWVGTEGGVARWRGGRFEAVPELGMPVVAMLERRDGELMVSSEGGGVWSYKDGAAQEIEPPAPFPPGKAASGLAAARTVDAFYEDSAGELWMGTLGGGLRLAGGKAGFSRGSISMRDGLFDDDIFGIVGDAQDRLWMACSKGLFSVERKNLLRFAAGESDRVTCEPFSPTDALRTIECKAGVEPAAWSMSDGRLWFATTRGVATVDPSRLPRRLAAPPVVIEEVAVDGRAEAPEKIIDLPAGRKNLAFRYTGLSFIAPGRVTFRYELEGFDRNWIDAGPRREAFYTNLPPGHYQFRVQACNAEGQWTDRDISTAAVGFGLAPLWYQHAWFIPLCVGLALAVGALLFQLRLRALRQRMQLVVAERSRIARELHDTLLQGFSGVTMEMQALSVQLPGERGRGKLEEIIRDAAACLREARRSVAGLREGAPTGLAALLEAAAREVTEGQGVELVLRMPGGEAKGMRLAANVEFNLVRIAREAMTNAVKHAGARRIEVSLELGDERAVLQVRDDGKGFTAKEPASAGHYGLTGMRERAREIGAVLRIETAPGQGTLVEVRHGGRQTA